MNHIDQPDFFAIPSPCIGVCQSNNKGFCIGCFRSREERLYWLQMTDLQKHQVMRLLAGRRKKVEQKQIEKLENKQNLDLFNVMPEQISLDF